MNVFDQTQRAQYVCDLGYNKGKADARIRVAEKARAVLDGDRFLQTDETIVVGGVNAVRFASELGKEAVKCETLAEVSTLHSDNQVKVVQMPMPEQTPGVQPSWATSLRQPAMVVDNKVTLRRCVRTRVAPMLLVQPTSNNAGKLYATIVNETDRPMALIKGKEVAKCIAADKVRIEEGDSVLESSDGLAMSAGHNREAAMRAVEIFQLVLEGSSGKSALEEHKGQLLSLFERFNDCFALTDFELGTTHLIEHDIELKDGMSPVAQPVVLYRWLFVSL